MCLIIYWIYYNNELITDTNVKEATQIIENKIKKDYEVSYRTQKTIEFFKK